MWHLCILMMTTNIQKLWWQSLWILEYQYCLQRITSNDNAWVRRVFNDTVLYQEQMDDTKYQKCTNRLTYLICRALWVKYISACNYENISFKDCQCNWLNKLYDWRFWIPHNQPSQENSWFTERYSNCGGLSVYTKLSTVNRGTLLMEWQWLWLNHMSIHAKGCQRKAAIYL